MERKGEISPEESSSWKHGIFGLMELWGLEANIFGDPPAHPRNCQVRGVEESSRKHRAYAEQTSSHFDAVALTSS